MSHAVRPHVFFETLTAGHRPLLTAYLRRGHVVHVYDFTHRLKTTPWLAELIDAGRVDRIYVEALSRADHDAMDAVEWLYPRFASHRLLRALAELYGDGETEPVVKKALFDSVFRYVFVRRDLARRRAGSAERVILVPDLYRRWERALRGWTSGERLQLPTIEIPPAAARLSEACGALARLVQAARVSGSAVRAIVRDRVAALRGVPLPPALSYQHLFALDQPFQTKFQSGRRFDFLIDGDELTQKNTGFVLRAGADGAWAPAAEEAGYAIIRRKDYEGRVSAIEPEWRRPIRRVISRTLLDPTAPAWLRMAAATGGAAAVREAPLFARVACENYIYTNQDDLEQRWRNVLVRRYGVRAWCFTSAIGGGYLYGSGPEGVHRLFVYQNPDHLVMSSRQLVDYHRRHRQRVREYHAIGNIWAEGIRHLVETGACDELRARWFGARATGHKIVAWFDTTFIEAANSESTFEEAIAWYRDLRRLLSDLDVLAIVKPSKDDAFFTEPSGQWSHPLGARVVALWNELRADPRIHFAGHHGDPASVIAASDLTVTFCFSSVSAEALGARRRAIWYEPGQRWRGMLYDTAPGLVAHGYEELVTRVRALLFETDDVAWERYLDRHVKGLVEDHLDGRAVSRFRALLASATPARGR